MKVLIISDGHGDLARLDALESVAASCDVVLFAGDFARFGYPETGTPFLERLAGLHDQVFSVTGNCDAPLFREETESYGLNVEASLSYFSGLLLAGSGGGMRFQGNTPNERDDDELVADLHLAAGSAGEGEILDFGPEDGEDDDDFEYEDDEDADGDFDVDDERDDGVGREEAIDRADAVANIGSPSDDAPPRNNLVIIAHHPPRDTLLDVVPGGFHVGSPGLRAFIEAEKPLLVVSGHIHESAAIDRLGPTTLVNPGALLEGRYAIAEITGGKNGPFAVASVSLETLGS